MELRTATPARAGMDEALLVQVREYTLTGDGSAFIVRGGKWPSPRAILTRARPTVHVAIQLFGNENLTFFARRPETFVTT